MSTEDQDKPLFSELPEWADVVPIPQYETDAPIAPILYSVEYKDATDYFRAIVKAGERSARVLQLTQELIRLNPAHYTAWQYRYETLLSLSSSLEAELKLTNSLTFKYLKTYQVWHHRRLLITHLRTPLPELPFLNRCLALDAKNYHTWSYRQWLLSHFIDDEDLWKGEIDFVENTIADDVRNNSAWHHRFFVVFGCGVREGEEDRARVIKRELIFTKQNISLAPNNPSAWNYLRGILDHNNLPYSLLTQFVKPYTVPLNPNAVDIVDLENPPPVKGAELPCVYAIEFLADINEKAGDKESLLKAVELWKSLANEHDTIRRKYWEHRVRDALQSPASA
ncbi:protein prenylyltransferase [Macrolepiota fuliginosa MF-IS2]|uniref:Protein farnesyltransferase/geranylgeranyltransferase type-1 subunit alpha n=1 Tax=Macrolepiota fuliginosa MF-IS2 TaxID=1400762 RepID=A0A9P5XIX9_9AGAR|nr:protein prenylyltransferase [Macrolepiota fuliginosa MF-IS2]